MAAQLSLTANEEDQGTSLTLKLLNLLQQSQGSPSVPLQEHAELVLESPCMFFSQLCDGCTDLRLLPADSPGSCQSLPELTFHILCREGQFMVFEDLS